MLVMLNCNIQSAPAPPAPPAPSELPALLLSQAGPWARPPPPTLQSSSSSSSSCPHPHTPAPPFPSHPHPPVRARQGCRFGAELLGLYTPRPPVWPPPGMDTAPVCYMTCLHVGGNGEVWGDAATSDPCH